MKTADVSEFRTLLMAKREEIVGQSLRREDIWIVQSNEQIETVQLAGQREFAARTLERQTKNLTQIDASCCPCRCSRRLRGRRARATGRRAPGFPPAQIAAPGSSRARP